MKNNHSGRFLRAPSVHFYLPSWFNPPPHPKRFHFVCSVLLVTALAACSNKQNTSYKTWEVAGGSKESIHYSELVQVDTSNVNQLQQAWTYYTRDADTVHSSQIQCNPIIIDGIMYGTTPRMKLFALDAATGKEKWVFDPADTTGGRKISLNLNNNRGVTYWSDGSDKRIFYVAGANIYAINAGTGKLISSFGSNGTVDLHDGLDRDVKELFITSSSAGIIYKDLLIMGSRVDEGAAAAPGHIRAYDVRSGKQQWIFHTIPHPGEPGYETWEDTIAYKHIGGANAWAGLSLDEKRGILFAPIGSASFDFYGGKRKGSNLYADCMLALDAATGKRLWHFQYLHHDIFDYDPSSAPALVTVTHSGKSIDAVAQTTKTGFVFLFNRETGEPLFPIEEKPVPDSSDLVGEKVWPTQPIPLLPKPFVRQSFTEKDINDLVPDSSYQDIKSRLAKVKSGTMFTPSSKQGTVIFPGFDGGAEWGGPAFDPKTGIIYVNANEMPWILTMVEVKREVPKNETYLDAGKRLYRHYCMGCHGPGREGGGNYPTLLDVKKKYNETQFQQLLGGGRRMMPAFKQLSKEEVKSLASFVLEQKKEQSKKFDAPVQVLDSFLNLPYSSTGYHKFLTREGYPAIKPPWGSLSAINLNTGQPVWKIPLGEFPELVKKGIPITGTENYGGPIVTSGGLLFIAATRDGKFRAFNKATGKLLWQTDLPAPGFATPSLYEVNGKQFIVIACGGGKLGEKSGDAYMAFALPGK
jgi:quinoprotein glucose dehydrogenase